MATATSAVPSPYDGLTLSMKESMSGYFKPGFSDPSQGAAAGRKDDCRLRFDVEIRIADLARFFRDPNHLAELTGTVSIPALGGSAPVREGRFELFSVDPDSATRRMVYRFRFVAPDGETYFLSGQKEIHDDRDKLDLVDDVTRLYTRIHRGADDQAPVYGAGELYFRLEEAPSLLASLKISGARSWFQAVGAKVAFASFVWGALREEYFRPLSLFYDTGYENLVLSGRMRSAPDSAEEPFFLVSGVHDKDFPWGDGEMFWDVLLVIGEGPRRRLYCITDRALPGLELDVSRGSYRYRGPLYRIQDGYAASFRQMKQGASHLAPVNADIHIELAPAAFDTVSFPFPLVKPAIRKMSSKLTHALRKLLPGERPPGIHITPHFVTVITGTMRIGSASGGHEEWSVLEDETSGECERAVFRNLKEPTLLYSYVCALDPAARSARVQITARTLRNERTDWAKDRLDAWLGAAVSRTTASEMLMTPDTFQLLPLGAQGDHCARPLRKVATPVIEVNNDQFPTAVFQRRIVEVQAPHGVVCLALEEDMSMMRLEALNCSRAVAVASLSGPDKFAALDAVLEAAAFDAAVDARLAASGKNAAEFSIVIKPNFMFAYDKRDTSTYTDPDLVDRLAARLRSRGFQNIKVAEAQSTYGEFFDHRGVLEMAEYLGFESACYDVVDMTEDVDEHRDLGPALGVHPISRAWRDADFRISFAKNKTHTYSYYSLTLKNIYGALPLANKFKEYHCGRGIYASTIEYLKAFPVHFGLIDAWCSADGPFGVFADPGPNDTRTVVGGADLVAVDWIGATKMGVDPMISQFMERAVKEFGKPEIQLIGDPNPYRPWLNVPPVLSLLANKGMDAEYSFGNLLYSVSAHMDEARFHHKSSAPHVRLLRRITGPLRRTFFLQPGRQTPLNRLFTHLFYWLGE